MQPLPHEPQFVVVLSAASQPVEAVLSQLPKPELQVPSTQLPAAQEAPALANVQGLLHAPQCAVVVCVFVSQPLAGFMSQLEKPELQTGTQVPDGQLVVPLPLVQPALQAPQWVTLLINDCSQPLPLLESQLPKLALQVPSVQVPVVHDSEALARAQGTPQPLQSVVVRMFVSQPLLALESQLAKPVVQLGTQVPLVQAVVPLVLLHWVPQAPQFDVVLS